MRNAEEPPQGQPKPLSDDSEEAREAVETREAVKAREVLRPNEDTEFIVMGLLSSAPHLKRGEEIDQTRLIAWNRLFEKSFKDSEELYRISDWLSRDEARRTGEEDTEFEGYRFFRYEGYTHGNKDYLHEEDLVNNPLAQKTLERIGALCNLEAQFIDRRLHIGEAYVEETARVIEEGNSARKNLIQGTEENEE